MGARNFVEVNILCPKIAEVRRMSGTCDENSEQQSPAQTADTMHMFSVGWHLWVKGMLQETNVNCEDSDWLLMKQDDQKSDMTAACRQINVSFNQSLFQAPIMALLAWLGVRADKFPVSEQELS